jgi:hypothetical protein
VHAFAAFATTARLDESGTGAGTQSFSSSATNFAALFFIIASTLPGAS